MIINIFILLIIFQIKHFVVDYPLQNTYMLGKFKPDWGFFFPLLAHAGLHGATTIVICLAWNPSLWWLGLVDMIIHFVMDRIKAGPKYLGRFKPLTGEQFVKEEEMASSTWEDKLKIYQKRHPDWVIDELKESFECLVKDSKRKIKHNTYFWWSLGFDALIHHLTQYFIIFILITG